MSPLETLRAARELVVRPGGWTQREYARNPDVHPVGILEPSAYSFCIEGAVRRVWAKNGGNHDLLVSSLSILRKTVNEGKYHGFNSVISFNDTPDRTQAEVISLFDRAIARLEAAP